MYEHATKHFKQHGITGGENLAVDVTAMQKAKERSVTGLTKGIEGLFKANKVDYVKGWGKINGAGKVAVTGDQPQEINATNIVVATGSIVTPLPQVPVDNDALVIVDSTGALELKKVPEKMVVIGGGVIGLELGSVWRRLGAEVTVVEYADSICGGLVDGETATMFHKILKKQGMKFMMSHGVTASKQTGNNVELTVEPAKGGAAVTINADCVLVSTGRKPATDDIGLDTVGISTNQFGQIETNGKFETGAPGVYAIGDCIPGPMLAHKAEEDGIAVAENIKGLAGHVNYATVPNVIYTHPEVAWVGKTEEELQEAGVDFNKGVFPFQANSRARTVLDSEGMVKMLSDAKTDEVLGVHIVGSNAGEMIAEAVLGMEYGASSEDFARTCHAHPTLSEAFKEAAMATYDKPIHNV